MNTYVYMYIEIDRAHSGFYISFAVGLECLESRIPCHVLGFRAVHSPKTNLFIWAVGICRIKAVGFEPQAVEGLLFRV